MLGGVVCEKDAGHDGPHLGYNWRDQLSLWTWHSLPGTITATLHHRPMEIIEATLRPEFGSGNGRV